MKRIALLSVHTSPIAKPGGKKVGGMNTYVREIAQELSQFGLLVDIFTRRTDTQSPVIDHSLGDNIRVIHIKAGPASHLGPSEIYPYTQQFTARVMAHSIRNNLAYDAIFSHYWLSGAVAQSLKEAWGIPFIQMFHTLGHMKNRIPSVTTPVPDIRIHSESASVNWADAIIANTPAERDQLLWLYHADRRKITICPPGVNVERFYPLAQNTARQQLGINNDENLLLFVGRIEPLKAVDTILHALAHLRQQAPALLGNTQFAIIGGDPQDTTDETMNSLKQIRDDLQLEEHVSFLGAKQQDELHTYYAAADAVLMPSEYESFGMVALEAMASGTPVIASEVGGLAYLVKDNQTGYLVPAGMPELLANRVQRLLTTPGLAKRMGQEAADVAKHYNWAKIAERLVGIFDSLEQPTWSSPQLG